MERRHSTENQIIKIRNEAESAKVDYLRTSDDPFLKEVQQHSDLAIKVVSSVTLIEELNL